MSMSDISRAIFPWEGRRGEDPWERAHRISNKHSPCYNKYNSSKSTWGSLGFVNDFTNWTGWHTCLKFLYLSSTKRFNG
jgi:hypothetical protein